MASPALYDPNFRRGVVFILEHDVRGAFGFIVNRLVHNVSTRNGMTPFEGGPVGVKETYVLHTCEESPLAGREVLPGYFVTDAEEVFEDVLVARESMKIFKGYSGWGPGQLEAEIESGSWYILKGDDAIVFCSPEDQPEGKFTENVWRDAVKRKGGLFAWYASYVKDPLLN